MKKVFLILIGGLVLCSVAQISSQQVRPLSLDEDQSTITNATTGVSWSCREFLSLIQSEPVAFNAGNILRFEFVFKNVQPGASIPYNYRLHLLTDLSSPCWVYETPSLSTKHCDNTWDVWNKFDDHRLSSFKIILEGTVPPPLNEKIYEPGFGEEFELTGIARKSVQVAIFLFDGKESIQGFTEGLVFHSTTEALEDMTDEMEHYLQQSEEFDSILNSGFENSSISFEKLREDIRKLSQDGRPGWANKLAEDLYAVHQDNIGITPHVKEIYVYVTKWGLTLLLALICAGVSLGIGYLVKRPYVPYKELDDATQMIEDIKNKVQILSYEIEKPELQTKISDLSAKDLSYLKNKMSMIEYLITKKEPEKSKEFVEGGDGEF